MHDPSRRSRPIAALLIAALVLSAAGCSGLPSSGPLRKGVQDEYSSGSAPPFTLVDVSQATINVLNQRAKPSLKPVFGGNGAPPELPLGAGDGVTVSIWEAGAQPLFGSSAAASAQQGAASPARGAGLPEQIIGGDGYITVPYAGRIPAAGRTLSEIQAAVQSSLSGKAAQPQVLVTLSHNVSNTVTVLGEVTSGGRVPLSPHGERLLDVVAAAGGVKVPLFETQVTLERDRISVAVPLLQVLQDSQENVYLQPGDVLVVSRKPETFTAFGASGRNAQIDFGALHVNLVEAVAKAGGLEDQRADPRGVFLFRREPYALASRLAPGEAPARTAAQSAALVPVIYRLDMSRASSYFLGSEFTLQDGDILYVSNAPATELQKFLQMLGMLTQPVTQGIVLDTAVGH